MAAFGAPDTADEISLFQDSDELLKVFCGNFLAARYFTYLYRGLSYASGQLQKNTRTITTSSG